MARYYFTQIDNSINNEIDSNLHINPMKGKFQVRQIPEWIKNGIIDHMLWVASSGSDGAPLDLTDQDLADTDLSHLDLSEAWMPDANFDRCNLVGTSFYASNPGGGMFRGADVQDCSFVKANLDRTDFSDANMIGSRLFRAECPDAKFIGANLTNCDMRGGSFRRANFSLCRLSEAQIGRAIFALTDFTGSILENLSGLDEAFIDSIVVKGSVLNGAEARKWIASQVSNPTGD